jgi:uncharacterized protein YjbI with pentapeptide repeats
VLKHKHVAEIQSAARPSDAQTILCRHEIHVAVIELSSNVGAGLHFLRWLRDRKASPCPDLPVVIVVKAIDRAALQLAVGVGIQALLRKPLSGEQLLKTLATVSLNPRPMTFGAEPLTVAGKSAAPPPGGTSSAPSIHGGRPAVPNVGGHSSLGGKALGAGQDAGIEAAGLPSAKPKEFIEVEEAPPAAAQDDGWADALTAKAKPAKTRMNFFDDPLPPAKEERPGQDDGADIDAALEGHALWVRSGGGQGKRANLEGKDLSGRSFEDALLSNIALRGADLSGCDCSKAQLEGADLRGIEVFGGCFLGANLAVARLRHAKLRGCIFEGANLKGADLAGADLSEAKFGDADLKGANLLGVALSGADLSGVSGLSQSQLENASGDAKTRLPLGLFLAQPKAED